MSNSSAVGSVRRGQELADALLEALRGVPRKESADAIDRDPAVGPQLAALLARDRDVAAQLLARDLLEQRRQLPDRRRPTDAHVQRERLGRPRSLAQLGDHPTHVVDVDELDSVAAARGHLERLT